MSGAPMPRQVDRDAQSGSQTFPGSTSSKPEAAEHGLGVGIPQRQQQNSPQPVPDFRGAGREQDPSKPTEVSRGASNQMDPGDIMEFQCKFTSWVSGQELH